MTDADRPRPSGPFELRPIGWVRSTRSEAIDDGWDDETSSIELDGERFTPDALAGLDAFSHVDVVYLFDQVDEAKVHLGLRHPRNNPDWPEVGIFAQRAKVRPNRLGVTTAEIHSVEGLAVHVQGLDAIDGTPVLDLKPHVTDFAPRSPVRQPAWITELMAGYW